MTTSDQTFHLQLFQIRFDTWLYLNLIIITLSLLLARNIPRRHPERWNAIKVNFTVKNIAIFYLSIIAITYFSFILVNWYQLGPAIMPVKRYLTGVFLFCVISTVFSITNYLFHITDKEAYVINADILKYVLKKERRELKATKRLQEIDLEILRLNDFKSIVLTSGQIQRRSEEDTLKNLSNRLNFPTMILQTIDSIQIGNTQNYVVTKMTVSLKNDLTYDNFLSGENYFVKTSTGKKEDALVTSKTTIGDIIQAINSKIEYNQNIVIPALNDYKTSFLPLDIFIQCYIMDMFGMRLSYVTPISFPARMLYLCFGIYKFLLLGTFISLLFK